MKFNKSQYCTIYASENGYHCDSDGKIYDPSNTLIKPRRDKDGYLVTTIRIPLDGKIVSYPLKVHRLQAFQKFGNSLFNTGIQVRHFNNIKDDNNIDNILIGNQSDNMLDLPKHIRIKSSKIASSVARLKNTKFTDEKIKEIGEFVHNGNNLLKDAIIKFNISSTRLSQVIKIYRKKYKIDKSDDMIKRSRISSAKSCRKYSDNQIREIRQLRKDGVRLSELRRRFNLSGGSLHCILTRNYISSPDLTIEKSVSQ